MIINRHTARKLPVIDAALAFDGIGQYASLSHANGADRVNFSHMDSFHISVWYQPKSTVLLSNLIAHNTGSDNIGWKLITGNKNFILEVGDGSSFVYFTSFKLPNLENNIWYYLSLNFIGGGAGSSTVEYFINGYHFDTVSDIAPGFVNTANPLEIAAKTNNSIYTPCELAYLRIFDTTLSQKQILHNLYNPGLLHPDNRSNCQLEFSMQHESITGTTLKETAYTYNQERLSALAPADATLIGYTDRELGNTNIGSRTAVPEYYQGGHLFKSFISNSRADNNYIEVPHDVALEGNAVMHFAFWMRLNSSPTADHFIVSKSDGTSSNQDYAIYVRNTSYVRFSSGSGGSTISIDLAAVNVGEWAHIAIGLDYTANRYLIYFNGNLKKDQSGILIPAPIPNSEPLRLFASGSVSDFGDISMYDFRYYKAGTLKSLAQIRHIMNGGTDNDNRSYHAPLNDAGVTCADISGNNNDGSFINYGDRVLNGGGAVKLISNELPPLTEVYNMENGGAGGRAIRVDNFNIDAESFTCMFLVKKLDDLNFHIDPNDYFLSKKQTTPRKQILLLGEFGSKFLRTINVDTGDVYNDKVDMAPYRTNDYFCVCYTQSAIETNIYLNGIKKFTAYPNELYEFQKFSDMTGEIGTDGIAIMGDTFASRSWQGVLGFFSLWSSLLPDYAIHEISVALTHGKLSKYLDPTRYTQWEQQLMFKLGKGDFYNSGTDLRIRNLARTSTGLYLPQFDGYPLGMSGTSAEKLTNIRGNIIPY